MTPLWFDEDYFISQKVIQANEINYDQAWLKAHGQTQWTDQLVRDYINEYKLPDGQKITAYDNFLASNGKGYATGVQANHINVSCTPLFDVNTYAQNMANWANANNYAASDVKPGEWNAENMEAHIFNDLRMSLWEHFTTTGIKHKINPSGQFDTHSYLTARAEAMSKDGGNFTVEDAIAHLAANGLNPVMDFHDYGQKHGLSATPSAPLVPPLYYPGDSPATPPVEPAPPLEGYDKIDAIEELTPEKSDYIGNAEENTEFIAVWHGEGDPASTLQPGVSIDGGAASLNTLKINMAANWEGFTSGGVANVGRVQLVNAAPEAGENLNFSAAKIADLEIMEVETDGPGAINLAALPAAVREVNIASSAVSNSVSVGWTAVNSETAPIVNIANVKEVIFDTPENAAMALNVTQGSELVLNTGKIADLTLNAPDVESVRLNVSGDLTLGADSNLNSATELELNLAAAIDACSLNLPNAAKIDVLANGNDVFLGIIGGSDSDFNFTVENAENISSAMLGDVSEDWITNDRSITANLNATGQINLNVLNAGKGDVDLTAAADAISLQIIEGNNINLDVSKVAYNSQFFEISAAGAINYVGVQNDWDMVEVWSVGSGKSSFVFNTDDYACFYLNHDQVGYSPPMAYADGTLIDVDLGAGAGDAIIGQLNVEGDLQRLNIDLGDDNAYDELTVNQATGGSLLVTVTNYNKADDSVQAVKPNPDADPWDPDANLPLAAQVFSKESAQSYLAKLGIDSTVDRVDAWESADPGTAIITNDGSYVVYDNLIFLFADSEYQA